MRSFAFVLFLGLTTVGLFADATYDDQWVWPQISQWQSYESGTKAPMVGSGGGSYWPDTKPTADPYRAVREGVWNEKSSEAGSTSSGDSKSTDAQKTDKTAANSTTNGN